MEKKKNVAVGLTDGLSRFFRTLGCLFDLIFFWIALLPVLPKDIKNGYFLSKNKIERKYIRYDKKCIAKKTIERMDIEYQERKKSSSEKIKILFQVLTLVFTIISAVLAYLIKEIKVGITPIFALSLLFFCISLFMIITYYRVSKVNVISFPNFLSEDSDEVDYLVDRLFCIEMNNARLDYVVTIYNAAFRYFYAAFILFLVALYMQFNPCFSWVNHNIKNQNITNEIQNKENVFIQCIAKHTCVCKINLNAKLLNII